MVSEITPSAQFPGFGGGECPKGILLGLPKMAPPNTPIKVEVGVPNWVILPNVVDIEVYYIAGTGPVAYDELSHGKGKKLGSARLTKCSKKVIGEFKLPTSGATVMAIVSPADVKGGKLYATWRIKAGSALVTNAEMTVNPPVVSTVAGGSFRERIFLRVPNDESYHFFRIEIETPWGIYRTNNVRTKGIFGISPSFTITVPAKAKAGTYYLRVKGFVDDKLVAMRNIKVVVKVPLQPKPTPTPTPKPKPPAPQPVPKPTPITKPTTPKQSEKSSLGPIIFIGAIIAGVLFGKK